MSSTGDGSWGHLAVTEHYGRKSAGSDYVHITFDDLQQPKYNKCANAGHCMIYSKHNEKVFGIYNPRAAVLMQMRFDGYIGFPGGLIDEEEDIVSGLNRELIEEVNIDIEHISVRKDDYLMSHWNEKEQLALHFYAHEVSLEQFKEIEKNALLAHDYGEEVMGVIRVPLYTMGDGYRGFPAFLSNSFIGNSQQQLLQSLVCVDLMTDEEVSRALSARPL